MLFSFHITGRPVFVHAVNLLLVIEKCFFRISCKELGKAASILVSMQGTWQAGISKEPGKLLQITW